MGKVYRLGRQLLGRQVDLVIHEEDLSNSLIKELGIRQRIRANRYEKKEDGSFEQGYEGWF